MDAPEPLNPSDGNGALENHCELTDSPVGFEQQATAAVSRSVSNRVVGWWLATDRLGNEIACAPLDEIDEVLLRLGIDPQQVYFERINGPSADCFLGGIEFEMDHSRS